VYAAYSPTSASEFPNDNPALHEGARWVCQGLLGPPRALLQAQPAVFSRGEPSRGEPSRGELAAELPAPAPEQPLATRSLPARSAAPAAARPHGGAPPAAELARYTGPLQLDLTRLVLPHRVADIPPPPDFIFRSLATPPPAACRVLLEPFEPAVAPPLTLLGYRVIDARAATCRVDRRWRIDIAPCVRIDTAPGVRIDTAPPQLALAAPLPALAAGAELAQPALAAGAELAQPAVAAEAGLAQPAAGAELAQPAVAAEAGLAQPAVVAAGAELESLAQALFPDAPGGAEPAILEPIASPVSEPPLEPARSELSALGLGAALLAPPASEAGPSQKKQQRRRAARVASSATLAVAASAGNAELTRTLAEIETAFAERRSEQPRAARNRQRRRAAPKTAAPKAAAMKAAAPKAAADRLKKAAPQTATLPEADEAPPPRVANAV
jgi:hypothetical protein